MNTPAILFIITAQAAVSAATTATTGDPVFGATVGGVVSAAFVGMFHFFIERPARNG